MPERHMAVRAGKGDSTRAADQEPVLQVTNRKTEGPNEKRDWEDAPEEFPSGQPLGRCLFTHRRLVSAFVRDPSGCRLAVVPERTGTPKLDGPTRATCSMNCRRVVVS